MRLVHGAASHLGLVRSLNEDSFIVGDGLYAVCDGMGGARAGEIASETACRVLLGLSSSEVGPDHLQQAVAAANEAIWQKSSADFSLAGMGTTLTLALATEGGLLVAHVGDSRGYILHEGTLTQLTVDHSLVGEMVRRGQLTPDEAAVHPHRSIITRALGTEEEVQADIFPVPLEPGDRALLCTDGLSGMVPDEDMARLLAAGDDPQLMAETLVAEALSRGGEDNITAIVVLALPDADSPASVKKKAGRVFGPSRREANEEPRARWGAGHWPRRLNPGRRGWLLILVLLVLLGLAGSFLAR